MVCFAVKLESQMLHLKDSFEFYATFHLKADLCAKLVSQILH